MLLFLCLFVFAVTARLSEHDRFMKTADAIAQLDAPTATLPLEAKQVIKQLIVDATGHNDLYKLYGPVPGAKK